MTEKASLVVMPTTVRDIQNMAEFCANNARGVTRTIVVSTRSFPQNSKVSLFTLNEFLNHHGELKRGRMVGAQLMIDAQPLYSDGRVFETIKADEALRIALEAQKEWGALLSYITIICDASKRDDIYEAMVSAGACDD